MLVKIFGEIVNTSLIESIENAYSSTLHRGGSNIYTSSRLIFIQDKSPDEVLEAIKTIETGGQQLPIQTILPLTDASPVNEHTKHITQEYIMNNRDKWVKIVLLLGMNPSTFCKQYHMGMGIFWANHPDRPMRTITIDRFVRNLLDLKSKNLPPIT
jgi:hypothetical protein